MHYSHNDWSACYQEDYGHSFQKFAQLTNKIEFNKSNLTRDSKDNFKGA